MFSGPDHRADKPWWLDELIRPINADLVAGNEQGATAGIARGREQLTSPRLDEDNARALELFLYFLDFRAARVRLDEMNTPELFSLARKELKKAPKGPVSELTGAMLILELLIHGHHLGLCKLSPAEFHKRFEAVPQVGRTHHFWYYTSGYAFVSGDESIVTEAYKLYLVNPSGSADFYTVQRLKLMLGLMKGKATKKDVIELLARSHTLQQVTEFNRVFYPRIESAGLVDEELLEACAAKEVEILTQGPVYIKQDAKDAQQSYKPRFRANL